MFLFPLYILDNLISFIYCNYYKSQQGKKGRCIHYLYQTIGLSTILDRTN